jgi:formate hydrogenlyase subunit 6/NADH:ubiquinone oxidoreductase subunit I
MSDTQRPGKPASIIRAVLFGNQVKEFGKMAAVIDKDTCTGCENCVEVCPVDAITMADGKAVVSDECIDCGQCVDECPVEAIEMQ